MQVQVHAVDKVACVGALMVRRMKREEYTAQGGRSAKVEKRKGEV